MYVKNRAINSKWKAGWIWNDYKDLFIDHWVHVQDKTYGPALKTQDSSAFCTNKGEP